MEIAVGLLYLGVGAHYARRAEGKLGGASLFALFWIAFGVYAISEAAWSLAVASMDVPLEVGITLLHVKVYLACAGFYGLVAYLARIYTGRDRRAVVAVYYAAVAYALIHSYNRARPIGQEVQAWRSGLLYASSDGLVGTLLPLAAILPALVAAFAFVALLRATPDAAARRRIGRLAVALLVFLAGLALGWLHAAWFWWPLVEKLLALAAVAGALGALGPRLPARGGQAPDGSRD